MIRTVRNSKRLLCKYGFYCRCETAELLNRLWKLVDDPFNYLTPMK